jgi:hypothetical protein
VNSDSVFIAIEEIAAHKSRLKKQQLLSQYREDSFFSEVLKAAYDPHRVFGKLFISDVPGNGNEMLSVKDLNRPYSTDLHYSLTKASGVLYSRIVNKDLKMGAAIKTINSVFGNLIEEMPYMRCSTPEEVPLETLNYSKGDWVAQPKKDGLYAEKRNTAYLSRQGKVLFYEDTLKIPELHNNFIWQGELTIKDPSGVTIDRAISNGMINSIAQGGVLPNGFELVYSAWDAIKDHRTDSAPYGDRLARIPKRLCITTYPVSSNEGRLALRKQVVDSKEGEGLVLKHLYAPWFSGTSRLMIKDKEVHEVCLCVIGLMAGKGRLSDTFGSLICVSEEGGLRVNVSGLTDAERKKIIDNWKKFEYSAVSVKFKNVIRNSKGEYSLFEPRYGGERFDKSPDSLEDILKRYPL